MEELVIRKTPLKHKICTLKEGAMISAAALELMQDQIDCLVELLIKISIEETEKEGRKKIVERDVEKAFKKLTMNLEAIDSTINSLKNTIDELQLIKEKSPVKYLEEV